jgi:hypothetical protein
MANLGDDFTTLGDDFTTFTTDFTLDHNYITDKKPRLKYMCDVCSKLFISRNGLWKHRQRCSEQEGQLTSNKII